MVKSKTPKGLRLVNVEDGPICIDQDEFTNLTDDVQDCKQIILKQNASLKKASSIIKQYKEETSLLLKRIESLEQVTEKLSDTKKQVAIPKETYDRLLKQEKVKSYYLVAVYSFYYYTAIWQKTNQPKATVAYVSKGLQLSVGKVRESKKQLIKMGLIEQGQSRDKEANFGDTFIRVKYLDALTESRRASKHKVNACNNNNKTERVENLHSQASLFDTSKVTLSYPQKCSNRLYKALKRKQKVMRTPKGHQWTEHFRKLTGDVPKKRIKPVLSWYIKNIGKQFVVKAYSAKSFCDNFIRIEDAMLKEQKNEPQETELKKTVNPDGTIAYEYEYEEVDSD